jgi:ketosteroid isomerase-like protein
LCRAVDYEGARRIFDPDMVAFGTFTDFMLGRDNVERQQWRNVWGTIADFRYDLDSVAAFVSADRLQAVGLGIWQSTGFGPDGTPFERPGRTTVVLRRPSTSATYIAVHTHMSLFRGTPDRSYGPGARPD